MIGLKTSFHDCKRIEVTQSMFSNCNKIKLESNNRNLRIPQISEN